MPLYEYQCDACGGRFEVIQKFSDAPAESCRTCGGGPVQRLISSPAIQFKGTGWYITDYSRKGKPAEGSGEGAKDGAKDGAGKDKETGTDAKAPASGESSSTKSSESTSTTASSPATSTPKAS